MPPKRHPDDKTAALILLERNGGSIPATALQTGIPERTLYNWQRQLSPRLQQYPPLPASIPPEPAEEVAFSDDISAIAFVRRQLMEELVAWSSRRDATPGGPYQRVLIIAQLVDRLAKLDSLAKTATLPLEKLYNDLFEKDMRREPSLFIDIGEEVVGPFYINRRGVTHLLYQAEIYYREMGCDARIVTANPNFKPSLDFNRLPYPDKIALFKSWADATRAYLISRDDGESDEEDFPFF